MFRLSVRDHVMIAHSFRGDLFGPAQRLHGATFVVDLELARPDVDEHGVVADIGALDGLLKDVLAPIAYRNLDELAIFRGRNTTTEVLARWIADQAAERIRAGGLGPAAAGVLHGIKVTVHESHIASASYEMPLQGP